jgi:uncharacterized membrane protein
MRSKAAIGTHPIHPMIVPLPIGAFFLALVGDILHLSGRDPFWYRFAGFCIAIGVVTALLAAVFGAIEYFGVKMSAAGARVATWHAILHKVGVVEKKDPEATEIGMRESAG